MVDENGNDAANKAGPPTAKLTTSLSLQGDSALVNLYNIRLDSIILRIEDGEDTTEDKKHWFEVTVRVLDGTEWIVDPELINKRR